MNNVCNADDKKIIKAADVSYEYTRYEEDGTVAIKNISFEIEEGSFNVIIGQNGGFGGIDKLDIFCELLKKNADRFFGNIQGSGFREILKLLDRIFHNIDHPFLL